MHGTGLGGCLRKLAQRTARMRLSPSYRVRSKRLTDAEPRHRDECGCGGAGREANTHRSDGTGNYHIETCLRVGIDRKPASGPFAHQASIHVPSGAGAGHRAAC